MTTVLGVLLVAAGGLAMGSGAWPFKLMRKYQFEHWWFVAMLVGLIVMPWTITLIGCPHALPSLHNVPVSAVVLGNLFAVGWGIANVLNGVCLVRIGVGLTGAIMTGLGVSLGAIVPMVFKGSGLFKNTPDLLSAAGLTVCGGVALMLVGVVTASLAGLGQHREFARQDRATGGYLFWLALTIVAGILSSFMTFVFVYSQGPIVAHLSYVKPGMDIRVTVEGSTDISGDYTVRADGMIKIVGFGPVLVAGHSAWDAAAQIAQSVNVSQPKRSPMVRVETGSIPATFGVFALGLLGGAVVNLGYAAYLLTKNRSWGLLIRHPGEFLLAIITGVNFSMAVALMGKGMLLLGPLGGSVGWGIQQAMQMTGAQLVGFISGEWRGIHGKPRMQMYLAIAILVFAAVVLAYGNTLATS